MVLEFRAGLGQACPKSQQPQGTLGSHPHFFLCLGMAWKGQGSGTAVGEILKPQQHQGQGRLVGVACREAHPAVFYFLFFDAASCLGLKLEPWPQRC